MNKDIAASAWKAARGDISVPEKPFMCLSLVRRVVENACFKGEYVFYSKYLVKGSSMRTGEQIGKERSDPWASDVEASVKALGYRVTKGKRKAGDLVFNWRGARPYGHVGVLMDENTVLENIKPEWRQYSIKLGRWLCLTPFELFNHTTIARLEPR